MLKIKKKIIIKILIIKEEEKSKISKEK